MPSAANCWTMCRANAGRFELFAALSRQVNEPGVLTVVVLEDVHWADEASIDLLRYLGRRLRGAAVLLVVTYRDDELSATDPLRRALGELAQHSGPLGGSIWRRCRPTRCASWPLAVDWSPVSCIGSRAATRST